MERQVAKALIGVSGVQIDSSVEDLLPVARAAMSAILPILLKVCDENGSTDRSEYDAGMDAASEKIRAEIERLMAAENE